jgi:hypothetical protein
VRSHLPRSILRKSGRSRKLTSRVLLRIRQTVGSRIMRARSKKQISKILTHLNLPRNQSSRFHKIAQSITLDFAQAESTQNLARLTLTTPLPRAPIQTTPSKQTSSTQNNDQKTQILEPRLTTSLHEIRVIPTSSQTPIHQS